MTTAIYVSNPEATALSEQAEIANRMAETLVKANTVASTTRAGAGEVEKR